jgi:imidazoleglycerol-phosphate dehydratase/histidinol-phosphatase
MKRILFLDRDGVVLIEPPGDYQIDVLDEVKFHPGVISVLGRVAEEMDFYTVMITNQDGLGTDVFPDSAFYPYHNLMLRTLESEGFVFDEMHIDRTWPKDNQDTRKPGIGLLKHLVNNPEFDMANSYMVGDRWSDIQLAKNLGCQAIYIKSPLHELTEDEEILLRPHIALQTDNWKDIYAFLKLGARKTIQDRNTNETRIQVEINLEGSGRSRIETGLGFFDHMLDQVARHGKIDLTVIAKGDLHIDEHHTIEDTGIALGEAFAKVLTDKRGMERYGFALPMDEAEAKVLIDFGGRSWLVWNAEFKREKIGEMPTEMFFHFFKSFSDAAKCNLNIECKGENEHHKIEAIFKAFAKAIRMAVKRDPFSDYLPSTKGVL